MKERHEKLIQLLNEKGELDIDSLVNLLQASPATVRRDLTELQQKGLITRTLGGAHLNNSHSLVIDTFEEKRNHMREEKEHVARKASSFVKANMVVAIDSGTTTWRLASLLKDKKPLTVFTTALAVIEELGAVKDISILCPGGNFRLKNLDFIGANAITAFKNLHADIAFIGIDSIIPGKGIYALDAESAFIGTAIANCAEKVIVLADHSKFNNRGCYQILPENKIDYVVTDRGLPQDIIKKSTEFPFKLILAD